MPEPFKGLLNGERVRDAGRHLQRVWPGFDRRGFETRALHGLDALEFKARAMQVADALEATLPDDFARAAGLIERALGPPGEGDDLDFRNSDEGLAGWICWPLGEFVARRGLAYPERALAALHALTQRFSAEFAIRPFLLRHPDTSFRILRTWVNDPSAHVRRLVSEGSRPRLPWGLQLKPLIADPSPTLPLLRALQDDGSAYVRRSVANHLNDIGKDHPALIADWLHEHLRAAGPQRKALLRHASRHLLKHGDPRVLRAWGLGAAFRGEVEFRLAPKRIRIGENLQLALELRSTAARPQRLEVDYTVHHVKADGGTRPKVFKGWRLELAAGETRRLIRKHAIKPVTTRRYYPGEHRIEVRINGKTAAEAAWRLLG
jgi:3-methyladenine DNA glycosylase AlkC